MNGLQLGIVVASYPQGMSVDVLLPDSGSRLTNVQVMLVGGASDSSGTVDLPDPGLPADDSRWNLNQNAPHIIYAILAFYKGNPICIGFLLPQVCQMTFNQKNRRISRHISDVYVSTDQFGNTEFSHPSGTYVRIGTSSAHEDLTGQDFDGLWAIKNNKTAAVNFAASIANNGTVKATIACDSNGNITLTCVGNLSLTANGTTGATLTTPNGNITLNTVTIDAAGNVHSAKTITGDTDVVAAGKSGKGHTHGGVTTGGSQTDPPT